MRATWLLIAISLAGCGNGAKLGPGDYADALTGIVIVNSPKYVELNSTLPNDPVLHPLVVLAEKYVVKAALIEVGVEPDTANNTVNSASWYWACQNLALFAGVEPVGRLFIGGVCAILSWEA